ncbi:MAG TPA: GNAT family N-acetyltransferase, partial [Mycobacterium sp.]|nr:GNAT family N-acetyltransferase [Mycobacterium sp.]
MVSWPDLGTRVTVRYRRPAGSVPPLTDAVGHLLAVDPVVRVRTKTGAVAEFAPADVVAVRVLTDAPVRASQIRALEHAAAAAWPGVEQTWLDGWLLRAGRGATFSVNSAVPLDISAQMSAVPAIVAWYDQRNLTPWLAVPDRLLRPPPGLTGEHAERVLVCDVSDASTREPDASITFSARPDDAWLRMHQGEIPVDVL